MDYRAAWEALRGAGNQAARSNPWLGVPAILSKPIVEAGLAGLGWGAGATKAAASGHQVDPSPSLYNMVNVYGLGGPAGGLTSGGAKAAPWFSALGRAVEAAPLKQAPAQQWAGTIKNTPGVKQEELDWLGVPEWLSQQKGPVTKQQLSDYISQNKVDVQEMVKGNPRTDAMGRTSTATDAKFSQYQLPGGENYRELLLTLPPNKPQTPGFKVVPHPDGNGFAMQDAAGNLMMADREGAGPRRWPSQREAEQYGLPYHNKDSANFQSGHYDEPNVLAHVRFNDRVDASGKKTLFLEEIQSDWHQKGRKQGYGVQKGRAEQFADGSQPVTGSGVPDAPFKTSWPELALKRMIKWAADNGYDSVSWTPGKVQAERYDLSKQVEHIKVHHDTPSAQRGGGLIEIRPKGDDSRNGIRVQLDKDGKVESSFGRGGSQFEGKTLDEIVGKEMADKILADMRANASDQAWGVKNVKSGNWSPRFATQAEANEYYHALPESVRKDTDVMPMTKKAFTKFEGVDLQVGGEGMKAFYDKMLVNAANKLGKKYGAKVGVTKLGSVKGKPSNWESTDGGGGMAETEVWSLPITDAMRSEVQSKGMPLFTGGKGGSLAAILNQALTGNSGESLGDILGNHLAAQKGR